MGRLLEKLSPDGEVTAFAYDKHGRLAQANNASQQLRFHYNASGRLIEEHQGEQVLRHSYNSLGLRTQTTLPSGDTLKYRFNNIGQLQSASFNDQLITKLKHNKLGQIAERKQGELTSEYDYDAMGRLSEHRVLSQAQKHAVIQRNYRYTQAGNLESIDDLNKGSTQYFYDALDRLKQVEGFVNEQFDFDPANNLIQQSEQPKAEQAQQNPNQTTENSQEFANSNVVSLDKAREQKAEQQTKGNRLAFQGDRHFTYDQCGNLIKEARGKNGKLITEFCYNAQNQLIEIDHCGTKTQYQYDALGRRTKKISADTETQFLWNGDVLLSETQRLKTIEKDESKSTEKTAVAKIYVFEPNSFKPLAQIQNNEIYHYHLDHPGTPQELTGNDGSIVWSGQYKTYGNLALKTVETIENNIRFQGQYFDQETGLHYNRHRYYNPNTGQFTQQDPVGLLGGLNNYQYVPNPVGWVDPFGLTAQKEDPNRFDEVYSKAPGAKMEIDALADSIAMLHGGQVAKAPIKSVARAKQKIANDYGGDPTKIKDLARNTIIVPQNKISSVIEALREEGANIKVIDGNSDPLGYSGVNSTIVTKSGLTAEIQVNSPEMIYAKESPEIAKILLGEETYNSISQKASFDGGKGHKYYEEWRSMDENDPRRKEIEVESKRYYDSLRPKNDGN